MNDFIIQFVVILTNVLYVALIARAILSWLNVSPSNPLVAMLYQVTEPILAPIRRVLPTVGMIDFSPMVAIILITVISYVFSELAR